MNQIISELNNNKIYKNLYLLPGFNYSTNNDNLILECNCNYFPNNDVISDEKYNSLFKKIIASKNNSTKKQKKTYIHSKKSAKKQSNKKQSNKKISHKKKL
tara:strand:- start:6328 stop:6630 length:303 start_codon:yes stop_codon:yes gene_type:complete